METKLAPDYFKSNTCYRFITKGKTAFKISIPKPEGGYFYRTVGFIKKGEDWALKEAIRERNVNGKAIWGKFWNRVVSNWTLLSRLPKNLEPRLYYSPDNEVLEYRANWTIYLNGEQVKVARRYSLDKHGKMGAYMLAKQELQDAHRSNLELLKFMGRGSLLTLRAPNTQST